MTAADDEEGMPRGRGQSGGQERVPADPGQRQEQGAGTGTGRSAARLSQRGQYRKNRTLTVL